MPFSRSSMSTIYEILIGNEALIKTAIYIGTITFSTGYLIPKGIVSFLKWKESKKQSDLAISISYCVGSVMLLVFILATMIVSFVRSFGYML